MSVTIKLEGLEEFKRALIEKGEEVRRRASAQVTESTLRVHSAAVNRIQRGPASGRVYEKYQPRRSHQASAPGQPPQSDTGVLASSVQWNTSDLVGVVFTIKDYGKYLEFGTKNMAARPWLFPSLEEERPRFHAGLKEIIR